MTSIEWTDKTWNPVRGCSRVSEGCRHCYAEELAARFSGDGQAYEGLAHRVGGEPRWTGEVRFLPEKLDAPLRWRKPRRVFVNSMSDLFHEKVTDEQIDRVFAVMALAKRHTFQILTKRPGRMRRYLTDPVDARWGSSTLPPRRDCAVWAAARRQLNGTGKDIYAEIEMPVHGVGPAGIGIKAWPLPNVELGVSVEDQATADERIPELLRCPAAMRWVSYEPALGPVDFSAWLPATWRCPACRRGTEKPAWVGIGTAALCPTCDERLDAEGCAGGLDGIVVGGESGPKARPFDVEWARDVVAQCRFAGAPVFVKQLGAWPVLCAGGLRLPPPPLVERLPKLQLRHPKGGDPAEWPEDLRVREWPAAADAEVAL